MRHNPKEYNLTIVKIFYILIGMMLLMIFSNYHTKQELENQKKSHELKIDSLQTTLDQTRETYQNLISNLKFISHVDVTMYQPVKGQTDNTPLITADMSVINPDSAKYHRWVALSRDLHERYGGELAFGDYIMLVGTYEKDGVYRVADLMNARFTKRIDILMGVDDKPFRYMNTDNQIRIYKLPQKTQKYQKFALNSMEWNS